MSSFFKVRLSVVPSSLEDDIAQLCFKYGASGISEALAYTQPDLTYDPDLLPVKSHDIDVFFEKKPDEKLEQELKVLSPRTIWSLSEEENKDWLAEWKKGFHAFQLVGPYWIVPSWEKSPANKEHSILIDPGMAFGTGTHATTKMASYFVHKACSKLQNPQDKTLLDVGTGTAILAMLAEHHKVGNIVGLEIDPEARRVARENIARNEMKNIDIPDTPLEELHDTFDIVFANIIDGVLINLRNNLINAVNPGGSLFLTGILAEREDYFYQGFIENCGMNVEQRLEKDEWVGYWLKKPIDSEA